MAKAKRAWEGQSAWSTARGGIFSDPGAAAEAPPEPASGRPAAPAQALGAPLASDSAALEAPAAAVQHEAAADAPAPVLVADVDGADPLQASNTVLRRSQWDWLDEQARLLSRRTGRRVRRADLIRQLVDAVRASGLSVDAAAGADGEISATIRLSVASQR